MSVIGLRDAMLVGALMGTVGAGAPVGTPSSAAPVDRLPAGCKWVEREYRDDVRIETCDAVASIQVRAMSFGPGFCAVEIRTRTIPAERIGITAPPIVFSGWVTLVNHFGRYSVGIENAVICDTGVRTQLRYSAPE